MIGIANKPTKRVRRVPPERRKKVSSACDSCKKRKLKCDGGRPCLTCLKRSSECKITSVDGRTLKGKGVVKQNTLSDSDTNYTTINKVDHQEQGLRELHITRNTYVPPSRHEIQKLKENSLDTESDSIRSSNGKSCILLEDEHGGVTYIGERSFLSVLYECRSMFREANGPSKFTEDLQKCSVLDKPISVEKKSPKPLPSYSESLKYVDLFDRNINRFYYVLDIDYFRNDVIYSYYNNADKVAEEDIALLYLTVALGLLHEAYSKKSRDVSEATEYFRSGLYKMQEIGDNMEIWLVQAYYLQFFFYQSLLKKSTAWLQLSIAIKRVEAMGIQRKSIRHQYLNFRRMPLNIPNLLRSLYICDRLMSCFLGRPISISENNWEFSNEPDASTSYTLKCQMEMAKLGKIIGKILSNANKSDSIDFESTKNIAAELKTWSMNLSKDLQIDQISRMCSPSYAGAEQDGYAILLVHVIQLNSVIFLGSPFLMFEMATKVRPEFQDKPRNRKLAVELFQATVRAAVLLIHLTYYFLNNNDSRIGIHTIVSSSFCAGLVIGIRLLHGGFEDDGHSSEELKKCLSMAVNVVSHFTYHSEPLERFNRILNNLKESLESSDSSNMKRMFYIDEQIERSLSQFDAEFFNSLKVADSHDPNLEALIQFQKLFLPQDSAPTDIALYEEHFRSELPYNCGTTELYEGDKF